MTNYYLDMDEVILYEGKVTCRGMKGNMYLTLTTERIILEREKGFFNKELELVEMLYINGIKFYNGEPQIEKKGRCVSIQTIDMNLYFTFSGITEATKFTGKIIDVVTGTTAAERNSNKVKDVINMVDDTIRSIFNKF